MKKAFFIFASVFLVCFIIYTSFSFHSKASNISSGDEYYYNEDNSLNEDGTIMTANNTNGSSAIHTKAVDTVKDSLTVLVNKEYSLPADYVPEDLVVPDVLFNFNYYDEKKLMRQVAATALEELFDAAKKEGLTFYAISGYRSYDRQKEIYDTNIATKGEEYTNRYSAKPGHSEHQTGLSMDVSTNSIGNLLEPVFAYTPEGKWLAANAHRFGFIIRYPENKESITGYSYEPWHVRYVGKDLAKYLYENNLTLEEYYNYEPSEVETTEISYDNVIDIDTSTEKKEVTPPSEEEIEKIEKEDDKKEDKKEEKDKSNSDKKDKNKGTTGKDAVKKPTEEVKKPTPPKEETPTVPDETIPDETDPSTTNPDEGEIPTDGNTGVPDGTTDPSTEVPTDPGTGQETIPPSGNTTTNSDSGTTTQNQNVIK